jgi:hypothetical protein
MRAHAESVNLQFERPLDEVTITNLICLYVVVAEKLHTFSFEKQRMLLYSKSSTSGSQLIYSIFKNI